MKKVLVYRDHNCYTYVYDVSTPELELNAFVSLFKLLDEYWRFYDGYLAKDHKLLYESAKSGDASSAKELLNLRIDYEDEGFEILPIQEV